MASTVLSADHVDLMARAHPYLTKLRRFEVARYVGKHGWISIDVDRVDWSFIEELVETSYRLIALERRVEALDESRE